MGPSGEMGLGEEPPFSPTGEPRSASLCPSPLPCLGPLPLSDDVARGCCIDCTKGAVSVTSFFFFFLLLLLFCFFVSFRSKAYFVKWSFFHSVCALGSALGLSSCCRRCGVGWRTDGAALPPPAEVLKAEKCARSRGRALPPAAPCSTYIEQAVHVGVYVCMYIATYILSVCVGVCVRELFKSKPCIKTNKQTKKIWLNLSLRKVKLNLRVFCQP